MAVGRRSYDRSGYSSNMPEATACCGEVAIDLKRVRIASWFAATETSLLWLVGLSRRDQPGHTEKSLQKTRAVALRAECAVKAAPLNQNAVGLALAVESVRSSSRLSIARSASQGRSGGVSRYGTREMPYPKKAVALAALTREDGKPRPDGDAQLSAPARAETATADRTKFRLSDKEGPQGTWKAYNSSRGMAPSRDIVLTLSRRTLDARSSDTNCIRGLPLMPSLSQNDASACTIIARSRVRRSFRMMCAIC